MNAPYLSLVPKHDKDKLFHNQSIAVTKCFFEEG